MFMNKTKLLLSTVIAMAIVSLNDSSSALAQSSAPRIAVMETALGNQADPKSFKAARQAGYRAIQMHTGMPDGIRKKPIDAKSSLPVAEDAALLPAWQKASQAEDVEIISLCTGCLNRCEIWGKDREVAMRVAKQTVDACVQLDVEVMLFPFFGPSKFQESDEAIEGVAEFMKEFVPYAAANNVVVGIEAPVTTVRVLELMERLEFPENLKIYYDTGNLFEKEDVYETIRKYAKDHFCEIHIKPAGGAVVGQDKTDLAKLARALDDAGYDKWLVYEGNRQGKAPVENLKGIEQIVSLRK